METTQEKQWLTTRELSEFFDGAIKPSTFEIWRVQGKGPEFSKFGRNVRYHREKALAWANEQSRQNTSE